MFSYFENVYYYNNHVYHHHYYYNITFALNENALKVTCFATRLGPFQTKQAEKSWNGEGWRLNDEGLRLNDEG